jgi:hypothetical protein
VRYLRVFTVRPTRSPGEREKFGGLIEESGSHMTRRWREIPPIHAKLPRYSSKMRKQRLVPPISVPILKARSPAHHGGRPRMKKPPRARPGPRWVSSASARGTLLAPDLFRQRVAALGLSSRSARLSGMTKTRRFRPFAPPRSNRWSRPNCDIGRAVSWRPLPDPTADL